MEILKLLRILNINMISEDILNNNKKVKRSPHFLSAFKALFFQEDAEITSEEEKEIELLVSESKDNIKVLENNLLKQKNINKKELNKNLKMQNDNVKEQNNNDDLEQILNEMNDEIKQSKESKINKEERER